MNHPFTVENSAPHIFLTADYEPFLGRQNGVLEQSIFEPADALAVLAEKFNKKIVFFVDMAFCLRLRQDAANHPELVETCNRFRRHLKSLLARGHHLQLHLHPQWLDAYYHAGQWHFETYRRYALEDLSTENDPLSPVTVVGCITQGAQALREISREEIPSYEISCFRAGGLRIQPFSRIAGALRRNGIWIDSSVAPGLRADRSPSCDFMETPGKDFWRFEKDVCQEEPEGSFLEMPIATFRAGPLDKVTTRLARLLGGRQASLRRFGDGAEPPGENPRFFRRCASAAAFLTYDFWDAATIIREIRRQILRGRRIFTLVGHPKFLSPYGLKQVQELLAAASSEGWS